MNFQFYLEKLFDSLDFKKFNKENPKAYLCGGFFSIDKESNDNQIHLDFFDSDTGKWFSFHLDNEVSLVPIEVKEIKIPEKIPDNLEFDFNWVENIILGEMGVNKINNKLQKILLSLQRLDGKDYLLGTVFVSGMGMLRVKIDLDEKRVIDFEKKSFFDLMSVLKK